MREILVTVSAGGRVVSVENLPEGVRVVVVDFNVMGQEDIDSLPKNQGGEPYRRSIWERSS